MTPQDSAAKVAVSPAQDSGESAPLRTLYELALHLTKTLSDAHVFDPFGIVLPRRKTIIDLMHRNVVPGSRPLFHLVTRDDAHLTAVLEEFRRDARPNAWDALFYVFLSSDARIAEPVMRLQKSAEITLTTLHVNAWGERSAVWHFPSERSGQHPPNLALSRIIAYDRNRQFLAPCDRFPIQG